MTAPACANMAELAGAAGLRALLAADPGAVPPALARHLRQGLAYTAGAALGEAAPAREECAAAFAAPNGVGLSAGARAWAKHAHRSDGWWGTAHGSVAALNARALELFDKVGMAQAGGTGSCGPDVGRGRHDVAEPALAAAPSARVRGARARGVRHALGPGPLARAGRRRRCRRRRGGGPAVDFPRVRRADDGERARRRLAALSRSIYYGLRIV
jgi:hypothetical protein